MNFSQPFLLCIRNLQVRYVKYPNKHLKSFKNAFNTESQSKSCFVNAAQSRHYSVLNTAEQISSRINRLHDSFLQSPINSNVCSCRFYAKKKGKGKGGKSSTINVSRDDLEEFFSVASLEEEFQNEIDDLRDKFIQQLSVRTTAGVFDNIKIETPEGEFTLIELGQVLQKSASLVHINLIYAPQYIVNVQNALMNSGLNINPQQEGTSLYIQLPKVTREHRQKLAKSAKTLCDMSKKNMRQIYTDYSKQIRTKTAGHGEDAIREADTFVLNKMHEGIKQIEDMTQAKQNELLGGH